VKSASIREIRVPPHEGALHVESPSWACLCNRTGHVFEWRTGMWVKESPPGYRIPSFTSLWFPASCATARRPRAAIV